MKKTLFIWHDADDVSDNYHTNGGVGVIAENLDAAREYLRTPYIVTGIARNGLQWTREERRVRETCDAFSVDPDVTLLLADDSDQCAWVWPNAGCC